MMNKCYLCDSRELALVADQAEIRFSCFGYDKRVLKCEKCDLIQLLPIWTEDELNKLYAKYSEKQDFKGAKRYRWLSSEGNLLRSFLDTRSKYHRAFLPVYQAVKNRGE